MLVKRSVVVLLLLMVISLAVVGLVFQPVSVVAQGGSTDTPTPLGSSTVVGGHTTATYIPSTPNVTPTGVDFSCPGTTPVGWGTYTPSPLWMIECAGCGATLTSTVTAVPTWSGTGTPPSPTSTFTSTSTPVPGGLQCGGLYDGFISVPTWGTCTVMDGGTHLHFTWSSDWPAGDRNASLRWYFTAPASYSLGAGWIRFSGLSILADEGDFHGNYNGQYHFRFVNLYGSPVAGSFNAQADIPIPFSVPYSVDHAFTFIDSGADRADYYIESGAWASWDDRPIVSGTADVYGVGGSTPTPMSPGTPVVSYCASVSPLDSGFGWDLFVDDGSPNCDMGWDAFDVLDYHVPTVQICLQPVRFGVIKLFSQSYEVGIFALAVAAAFFWRFWRTI